MPSAAADSNVQIQIQFLHQEILRADLDVKRGISEIRNSPSHGVLAKLTAGVKEKLTHIESLIGDLENAGSKIKSLGEKANVLDHVKKQRDEREMDFQNFRTATLHAIKRIDQETREGLMSSGKEESDSGARRRVGASHTSPSAQMRDDTSKTTESLSHLVSRMNEEVVRSGETLETLVRSSEVLGTTGEEFKSMGGTIQSSGRLLSKYSRRELTDKILIFLTVCFFLATVLYIVQQRIGLPRFW